MGKLSSMPNVGKSLAEKLIYAGILESDQLVRVGSKQAFLKIKDHDHSLCFNLLCALEGAVQGIRWIDLDDDTKEELKIFYDLARTQPWH